MGGSASGGVRGVGVEGVHLDACGNVIDDADGLGVSEARQRVGDKVELHLPGWLSARLLPVDGLAGRALQAPILGQGRLVVRSPGVPAPPGSRTCSPPLPPFTFSSLLSGEETKFVETISWNVINLTFLSTYT